MVVEGNYIKFNCTGNKYFVDCGIIGLSEPDNNGWVITGGYDHYIICDSYPVKKEEKLELAEYMIILWTKYRDAVASGKA
jgi:hypothetical protein